MTLNLPVLDNAIEHITTHPDTWEQSSWRCGTGMCLFGWICAFDSHTRWLTEDPEAIHKTYTVVDGEKTPQSIFSRTTAILGITFEEADELSHWNNTLNDIQRLRDKLATRYGIAVTP